MSDFGATVIVKRTDGARISEGNRAFVDQTIRAIQVKEPQQNAIGEPFLFRLVGSHRADGEEDIAIVLSEYWLQGVEEGEYEFSVEEILERDRPRVQVVKESMAWEMGPEYSIEMVCGTW